MKSNLLIHIPHSSTKLPYFFWKNTIISKKEIQKENIFISDYLVHKFIPKKNYRVLTFRYSRLFCDVERFKDNNKEKMSNYGMGAIYTHDSNKNNFIKYNSNYRNYVLKNYYDKHHNRLNNMVTNILRHHKYCYIIDLHSFSNLLVKKLFNYDNCPDICIGTEDGFSDENLVNFTTNYFINNGYTVKLNYPYQGSIIPNKYFKQNNFRIKTMMIEINKRIYLKNGSKLDIKKYKKLKNCMLNYYNILNTQIQNKD